MNINKYYKTVAFIPVRGGSKSIPLKNIKEFCGKPLVYWSIRAAVKCEYIDKVFVATDSGIIRKTVEDFGFSKVKVIDRNPDTATDTASTESAMLDFAEKINFDNIILIQATSPLLSVSDLNNGLKIFFHDDVDSVLSVVPQKRFIWKADDNKIAESVNYNPIKRPRRQEFDPYYVENGAFYISSKENLIKHKCRISGKIAIAEMNEDTYYEIDEPSDWYILEMLKYKTDKDKYMELSKINLFITDVDGVLTDGGMYYSESGEELKKFNTRDGMGLSNLKKIGITTMILTGEDNPIVDNRAKKLGIDYVFKGVKDKKSCLDKFFNDHKEYSYSKSSYIGDDINDVEVLKLVNFSATPFDANNSIKNIVSYVCEKSGGKGCVREIADMIYSSHG